MNALLSGMDLLRLGIIVYVALWGYFKLRYVIAVYWIKGNVFRATSRWLYRARIAKGFGWFLVIAVPLVAFIVFPTVKIISRDASPVEEGESDRNSFRLETRYAPFFYYKGHTLMPFTTSIINDTDSTLALYSTSFFNKRPSRLDPLENYRFISPHSRLAWREGVDLAFETPSRYAVYYNDKKNPLKTVWTLDLKGTAINDREEIEREIANFDNNFYTLQQFMTEPDSITLVGPYGKVYKTPGYTLKSDTDIIRDATHKALKQMELIYGKEFGSEDIKDE